MQTTTTGMQPLLPEKNNTLSKPAINFNHFHSLNFPSHNPKTLHSLPSKLNSTTNFEIPAKIIKGNDGTGYNISRKVDNNSSIIHSSSIRVPTPVKPLFSKLSKETKPLQSYPKQTLANECKTADQDWSLNWKSSKQEASLDQKILIQNQLNGKTLQEHLRMNLPSRPTFMPSLPNLNNSSSNVSSSNFVDNYNLMDILNIRFFEMMYEQLNQEFLDTMKKHAISKQSKTVLRYSDKISSNMLNNDSRNYPSENFLEINIPEQSKCQNQVRKGSAPGNDVSYAANSSNSVNDASPKLMMISEEKRDLLGKVLSFEKEHQQCETDSGNKKKKAMKKILETPVCYKELNPQKRPANKWQAIKAAQDHLFGLTFDLASDVDDRSQKQKDVRVGAEYQAVIPTFVGDRNQANRRNAKIVWHPENAQN